MRPPRTPMQRRAVLRLMAAVPDDGQRMRLSDPVAYWDRRTSGNDARAALSLACGAHPSDVDPVLGTHDFRPAPTGERAGTSFTTK